MGWLFADTTFEQSNVCASSGDRFHEFLVEGLSMYGTVTPLPGNEIEEGP